MKSVLVIASFFALGFTLVNGGAITVRSPFSSCGDGGEVLTSNNFEHNGNTIGFVSGTCPQAASKAKRRVLEERHYVCSDDDCIITCENDSKAKISPDDCAELIEYLGKEYGTFSVPAGSYRAWYYDSCTIYFLNADTVPYTACYETVIYEANATANACLGKTNGGVCAGTKANGLMFAVVIGSNDTARAGPGSGY